MKNNVGKMILFLCIGAVIMFIVIKNVNCEIKEHYIKLGQSDGKHKKIKSDSRHTHVHVSANR